MTRINGRCGARTFGVSNIPCEKVLARVCGVQVTLAVSLFICGHASAYEVFCM